MDGCCFCIDQTADSPSHGKMLCLAHKDQLCYFMLLLAFWQSLWLDSVLRMFLGGFSIVCSLPHGSHMERDEWGWHCSNPFLHLDNHGLKHQPEGSLWGWKICSDMKLFRVAAVWMVLRCDGWVDRYICLNTPVLAGGIAQVKYFFCKHDDLTFIHSESTLKTKQSWSVVLCVFNT